jgi:hypothetical protein
MLGLEAGLWYTWGVVEGRASNVFAYLNSFLMHLCRGAALYPSLFRDVALFFSLFWDKLPVLLIAFLVDLKTV